jgi:hypothetical protein
MARRLEDHADQERDHDLGQHHEWEFGGDHRHEIALPRATRPRTRLCLGGSWWIIMRR